MNHSIPPAIFLIALQQASPINRPWMTDDAFLPPASIFHEEGISAPSNRP
jgi:hypothetical protein